MWHSLDDRRVNSVEITSEGCPGYPGSTAAQVDNLTAEIAAYYQTYRLCSLTAHIDISNLHKETKKSFTTVIEDVWIYGELSPVPSKTHLTSQH